MNVLSYRIMLTKILNETLHKPCVIQGFPSSRRPCSSVHDSTAWWTLWESSSAGYLVLSRNIATYIMYFLMQLCIPYCLKGNKCVPLICLNNLITVVILFLLILHDNMKLLKFLKYGLTQANQHRHTFTLACFSWNIYFFITGIITSRMRYERRDLRSTCPGWRGGRSCAGP